MYFKLDKITKLNRTYIIKLLLVKLNKIRANKIALALYNSIDLLFLNTNKLLYHILF